MIILELEIGMVLHVDWQGKKVNIPKLANELYCCFSDTTAYAVIIGSRIMSKSGVLSAKVDKATNVNLKVLLAIDILDNKLDFMPTFIKALDMEFKDTTGNHRTFPALPDSPEIDAHIIRYEIIAIKDVEINIKNRWSDYICNECADEWGGIWPEGHCASFHDGACGRCGKNKSLANVGDWNWPDKARGMRD